MVAARIYVTIRRAGIRRFDAMLWSVRCELMRCIRMTRRRSKHTRECCHHQWLQNSCFLRQYQSEALLIR